MPGAGCMGAPCCWCSLSIHLKLFKKVRSLFYKRHWHERKVTCNSACERLWSRQCMSQQAAHPRPRGDHGRFFLFHCFSPWPCCHLCHPLLVVLAHGSGWRWISPALFTAIKNIICLELPWTPNQWVLSLDRTLKITLRVSVLPTFLRTFTHPAGMVSVTMILCSYHKTPPPWPPLIEPGLNTWLRGSQAHCLANGPSDSQEWIWTKKNSRNRVGAESPQWGWLWADLIPIPPGA